MVLTGSFEEHWAARDMTTAWNDQGILMDYAAQGQFAGGANGLARKLRNRAVTAVHVRSDVFENGLYRECDSNPVLSAQKRG